MNCLFRYVCFIATFLLQSVLLYPQSVQAMGSAKANKMKVQIQVKGLVDKDTGRNIRNGWAQLYVLPDKAYVCDLQWQDSIYSCNITAKPGWKYVIEVGAPKISTFAESVQYANGKGVRYTTVTLPTITIPTKPNTPQGIVRFLLPEVKLTRTSDSPRPVELKEVTVTASKVKFYNKGDTLIFNADAFVLPEGSMLDALVARLPGVEIHRNGRIFCNGRFVSELLLNGRDLFNGDKQLMLQNLASYTVKDIAVYDKLGRNSELFGANVGDSRYVMDVRLKKEYAMGWLGNIEIGAAIGDRYLGQLFGMWYNDRASIVFNAGANNMTGPSSGAINNEVWKPQQSTSRDSRFQNAGLNYTWKDNRSWEIKGDVKYDGSKVDEASETRQINFFDTGDTYSYKWDDLLSRSMSISTTHNIYRTFVDKANITLSPSFKYTNNKNRSNLIDGSFTGEIKDMSRQLLADIYSTDGSAADSMIYRNLNESMSKGRNTSLGLSAGSFIALTRATPGGSRGRTLDLTASLYRTDTRSNAFNRYIINRGTNPAPDNVNYQYRDGAPTSNNNLTVEAKYTGIIKDFMLYLNYGYRYNDSKQTSMMYHLEGGGFDAVNSVFGYLPSMREYAPTLDPELSYRSQMREHSNRITPGISYNIRNKNNLSIVTEINSSFEVLSRDYTYLQEALGRTQHLSPIDFLYSVSGKFRLNHTSKERKTKMVLVNVGLTTSVKDLYSMIDVDNNADPLNVYVGNPDLKNGMSLSANVMTNFSNPRRGVNHSVRFYYNAYFNQLAKGFEYDQESGVRTYKTYNVNGNWDMKGEYSLYFNIGKGFGAGSFTNATYRNSVDLIGTGSVDGQRPPKSVVRVSVLSERFNINWSKDRFYLVAKMSGSWTGYSSPDKDIIARSSWNFGGGIDGRVSLPYGWELSSDISLYGRRGYNDSKLNTSDVIWNARISKTAFKNKVVFIVDAYDLLRQYNSVNYIVNAYAKTEQIKATLPRYVLLHIQYHFNKPPKKMTNN